MSGKRSAGKGGSSSAAAAAAEPPPYPVGTIDAAGESYLQQHRLEDDEGGAKAEKEFGALTGGQKEEINANSVRFMVLCGLSGSGLLRATELQKAVLKPGQYGDPKSVKGPFLIQKALPDLEAKFGLTVARAFKTHDASEWRLREEGGGEASRTSLTFTHTHPPPTTRPLQPNSSRRLSSRWTT